MGSACRRVRSSISRLYSFGADLISGRYLQAGEGAADESAFIWCVADVISSLLV